MIEHGGRATLSSLMGVLHRDPRAEVADALVARLAAEGGPRRVEGWRQEHLSNREARTRDCGLFDAECWVVHLDVGFRLLYEVARLGRIQGDDSGGAGREGVPRVSGLHLVIASARRGI